MRTAPHAHRAARPARPLHARPPTARHACRVQVLLMLARMMSPLTPFFTELMYQNLRRVIPEAPASVHYLMMPEVNQSAIDPKIEFAIQKMQQVLPLGRACSPTRARLPPHVSCKAATPRVRGCHPTRARLPPHACKVATPRVQGCHPT